MSDQDRISPYNIQAGTSWESQKRSLRNFSWSDTKFSENCKNCWQTVRRITDEILGVKGHQWKTNSTGVYREAYRCIAMCFAQISYIFPSSFPHSRWVLIPHTHSSILCRQMLWCMQWGLVAIVTCVLLGRLKSSRVDNIMPPTFQHYWLNYSIVGTLQTVWAPLLVSKPSHLFPIWYTTELMLLIGHSKEFL